MHRKLGQRSCIQKSGLSEKDKAAAATQSKEKNEKYESETQAATDAKQWPGFQNTTR
jgi:hypothetical protein